MANAPIESKVKAAATGAVGGGIAAQLALWVLGCAVWSTPWDAAHAAEAIGAVPGPLLAVVNVAVPAAAAFYAGFLAKHTSRPDLTEVPLDTARES